MQGRVDLFGSNRRGEKDETGAAAAGGGHNTEAPRGVRTLGARGRYWGRGTPRLRAGATARGCGPGGLPARLAAAAECRVQRGCELTHAAAVEPVRVRKRTATSARVDKAGGFVAKWCEE